MPMNKAKHSVLGTNPGPRVRPPSSVLRPPSSLAIPAADRLHAKELARLEGCSPGTARRLMRSGVLGPVYGRNARDRWVARAAYLRLLARFAAKTPSRLSTVHRPPSTAS